MATGRCSACPRRSIRRRRRTSGSWRRPQPTEAGVEIILETEIDALDITVLKGGGDEVGKWALENGFLLSPDAPEVLDFYARRSPVFMAAKFDATRAAELGQGAGDSTPIMATIPTDRPWVPVHILQLGLEDSQRVEADVFLLTDDEPELLAGGPGLTLERSEAASDLLLDDLRSDVGMKWVPEDMWLSYLQLDADAEELDYDLAVAVGDDEPSIKDAGVGPAAAVPVRPDGPGMPFWPLLAGGWAALVAVAALVFESRRRAVVDAMRRFVSVAIVAAAAVAATTAGYAVADRDGTPAAPALGPEPVTVVVDVEHSRFVPDYVRVVEGTEVRFVLRNGDPINHELIVGPDSVHARHQNGTEAYHPPKPGELSVGPDEQGVTSYVFRDPGTVEMACHLPGHYAFGMKGEVEVVAAHA